MVSVELEITADLVITAELVITAPRPNGCQPEQRLHQFFTGAACQWCFAPARLWRGPWARRWAPIAAAVAVAAATRLLLIKQLAHQLGKLCKTRATANVDPMLQRLLAGRIAVAAIFHGYLWRLIN